MVTRRFFLGYSKAYIMLVAVMGLLLSSGLSTAHGSTVIAFDAAASTSCVTCGVTLTWSHTIGGGTNGILIVGVSHESALPMVSVMYGSSSLKFIAAQNDPTNNVRAEAWYLLNPPTGTALITVTVTPPPPPTSPAVGGSVSYFNVASLGTANSAGNVGGAASVIVNANPGDLVTDVLALDATGATPGVGQTQRWNVHEPFLNGGGSDKPASSSVTMTWTGPGTPEWAIIGIDLQPFIAPIPEYPLGLALLAIFMIISYGLIRRRTKVR